MTDRAHMPTTSLRNALCYEELMEEQSPVFDWPSFDENSASSLCYTSGTTGLPKGVLYSHRSNVIHAYAAALPDALNVRAMDTVLPVVPLFHANGWGLAYTGVLNGSKLVLPGAGMDGESVCDLLTKEKVNFAAGVPTVWLMLLNYLHSHKKTLPDLKRTLIGGSAAPQSMVRAFMNLGVEVVHAWGMTELSPLGTVCSPKRGMEGWTKDQRIELQKLQGRPVFDIEMKIVNDEGVSLPHDGEAFGRLLVRGPWVIQSYYKADKPAVDEEGWFDTGDVASIDKDSYMQIRDRVKDVVKSGGEWISSIELENVAVGHPDVAEAAVIGVAHPKWDERPLLIVRVKPGATPTKESILAHVSQHVAKWWVPDDVVFGDIPHTATGKISKLELRKLYGNHVLPTVHHHHHHKHHAKAPVDAE